MSVSYDFSGRAYLVTGGSRGIGRGIVEALLASGAKVYALGRSEANLAELKKALPAVETIRADVADVEGTVKTIQGILPLNGLVNNAGVLRTAPVGELSEEAWDDVMAVNVRGPAFLSQAVARAMVTAGVKGSIVNVSSSAAQKSSVGFSAYCASKAALDSLTRSMALELGPSGIRVNSVNPTVVMTDMGVAAWSDPAKAGPKLARIPLGRFASVEDCVGAVLWLLSDASGMTTGAALPVEGGYWAH